jgi:hypothetical protein
VEQVAEEFGSNVGHLRHQGDASKFKGNNVSVVTKITMVPLMDEPQVFLRHLFAFGQNAVEFLANNQQKTNIL